MPGFGGGILNPKKKEQKNAIRYSNRSSVKKKEKYKYEKKLLMVAPFICLATFEIATILSLFDSHYSFIKYMCNISGTSILLLLPLMFFYRYHNFCSYSIISLKSLLFINIINQLDVFFNFSFFTYYWIIDFICITSLFIISLVFLIRKK